MLALILAAVVVSGSTGSPSSRVAGPVSSLGWARMDLRPISQPAPIDREFVLYTVDHGNLRITGLDARTGVTRWSDAASASFIAPGEPPTIAIVDGLVIYLRRVGPATARVVGVDPASGRTAWQSQAGGFTSWPLPCADDPTAICTSGYMASAPYGASYLRFDVRTGALLPSASISPGSTGRLLAEDLVDPGTRQPEQLLAIKGSSMAWSRTLASIFTMPGASTDWGWNFDRIPRLGLYVGSVGARPPVYTRTHVVVNLAGEMTAAFRISDGSVIWRAAGAQYTCSELPCPGGDPSGWADPAAVQDEGPTVAVGLRETGTVSGSPLDIAGLRVSPGADASLDGFDPASGRVLWRFDAGHDLALLKGLTLPPQTGVNTIVMRDSQGRLVALDLATGSRRALSPLALAWCRPLILYKQSTASSPYHELEGTTYVGQPALEPCTAAGRPTQVPSQAAGFLGQLAAQVGQVTAWSEATGVFARPA